MATPNSSFSASRVEGPPSPMSVDDVDVEMTSNPSRPPTPSIDFPTFCIGTNYDTNLPENKEPDYLQRGRERNRYRITQQERKKALLAEAPKSLEDLRDTVSRTCLYIEDKANNFFSA